MTVFIRTRRFGARAAVAIAGVALIGFISNLASSAHVESTIRRECESSIVQTARLWHLPLSELTPVPASALHLRNDLTADGKHITVHFPPTFRPPYAYAYARQVAPFVLKVRYGWAVAGPRMAFGQGGERVVVNLFGFSTTIRDRAEWNL
jgi:hypothetical protein